MNSPIGIGIRVAAGIQPCISFHNGRHIIADVSVDGIRIVFNMGLSYVIFLWHQQKIFGAVIQMFRHDTAISVNVFIACEKVHS